MPGAHGWGEQARRRRLREARTSAVSVGERPRSDVLVVAPTLRAGGAERVVTEMLRHFHARGWGVSLALLDAGGARLAGLPDMPVFDLRRRTAAGLPAAVWRLARLLERRQPSVVVSHMWPANVVSLLAALWPRRTPRVVVCEHSIPSLMLTKDYDRAGPFKRSVLSRLYPRADAIVAVSDGVKRDLCTNHHIPGEKVRVIHDPIDIGRVRKLAMAPADVGVVVDPSRPVVIAVSRLSPEKDIATLIRAFASVLARKPSRLLVVGEGPERPALENLVRELRLAGAVDFAGFDENPYRHLARAAVFVMSSRVEGFGMVLLEAMAVGVPIVSTRAPSGPSEILLDGQCGLLVPVGDAQALSEAIVRVLDDPALASRLVERGTARVGDFATDKIMDAYHDCLSESPHG